MTSIDTNLLVYAQNRDCVEHRAAYSFLQDFGIQDSVVICELVLVELYLLLRNPAVFSAPLSAEKAARICQIYRNNPRWRLVESAPVMSQVWEYAAKTSLSRRRIIDVRLALTLQHHGVTDFATANTRYFKNLGFRKVWNPLRTN